MDCLSSQTKPWEGGCVARQTGYNGQNRPRELSETWRLSPNSSPHSPPWGAAAQHTKNFGGLIMQVFFDRRIQAFKSVSEKKFAISFVEFNHLSAEVGTRYFIFGPLSASPLFKNLSPLFR